MKKVLFLDLEETIINDFNEMRVVNGSVVKEFVAKEKFDEIHIFSFAIWDDNDVDKTASVIIPFLNKLLGSNIETKVMKVSDMQAIVQKNFRIFFDFDWEFSTTFNKDGVFQKVAPVLFPGCEIVLLDDTVENSSTELFDTKTKLRMVNVNNIISEKTEVEKLRQALLDIKNGKDAPCAIVNRVLG
jgi:hypothetical protein